VDPYKEAKMMSAELVTILVLAALALGAVAAWVFLRKRRSSRLRQSFGPEYERAVESAGRQEAERELEHRQERVRQLDIRALPPGEADRFAREWQDVQKQFVDSPARAVDDADRLVTDLMQRRGYPMADFEQRAADISVDHPQVVEHYRAGHTLAARARDGGASTEGLRQAMVHYRTLFDELLEERPPRTEVNVERAS
jgi:hypothetical protein